MRNSSWEDDLWQEISINSVNSWLSKLGFLYRCSSYSCLNSFGYFPSFAHTHIPSGSPAVTPSVVPLSLPSALLTTISTDGKIRNGLSWIFIILFFGSPFRLDFIVVPITDQRYRRNSIAIQHSNLCIIIYMQDMNFMVQLLMWSQIPNWKCSGRHFIRSFCILPFKQEELPLVFSPWII